MDSNYSNRLSVPMLTFIALMALAVREHAAANMKPSRGELDGDFLVRMGTQYDKPLLRLLGKTFQNLEQKLQYTPRNCDEWSSWSGCTTEVQQFGMKVRTRRCFRRAANRGQHFTTKIERDAKVCEEVTIVQNTTDLDVKARDKFVCPFALSENGFCLKWLRGGATKATAQSKCRDMGGYVVNLNSPQKMQDVLKMPIKHQNAHLIWIDGERDNVMSPWRFTYDTYKSWSPQWSQGYPLNRVNYKCLVIDIDKKAKMDYGCTSGTSYACEIVRKVNP